MSHHYVYRLFVMMMPLSIGFGGIVNPIDRDDVTNH
jgi:hypothetical protein